MEGGPRRSFLTAAKGRHALGREILAYALLPLHCALGFLMYTGTHTLALALTNRLQLSGSFDDLGPAVYVQASVSILTAILLAVAALVLVPLLAGYYLRGAASGGMSWRVARVTGGQLLYWGWWKSSCRSACWAACDQRSRCSLPCCWAPHPGWRPNPCSPAPGGSNAPANRQAQSASTTSSCPSSRGNVKFTRPSA